jgi:hypothetical protein
VSTAISCPISRSATRASMRRIRGTTYERIRQKSICCVTLILRRCGVPTCTPHSSEFASLASGAFYEFV